MNKRKIDVNNQEEVRFVYNLYIESFPLVERRPFDKVIDLLTTHPNFTIDILLGDNKFIGFLSYWSFEDFIFAEHFAIDTTLRNSGYGKQAMQLLLKEITTPIILEVELPTTIIADRRIGFYQRLGFKYWENIQYQQPSYHNDGVTVPMKLMSFGNIDLEKMHIQYKEQVYKEVYSI